MRGLRVSIRRLGWVAIFSGAINVLTLSGSIYMLQVYDRVIPSRNVTTLAGLSLMVVLAYVLQGYLDALRARMLSRIGSMFDADLQEPIFLALATLPLMGAKPMVAQQPVRDLEQIRTFLSGMGPTAFMDMPFIPVFLVVLYLFHPLIGFAATLGASSIIAATLLTERQSRGPAKVANETSGRRQLLADATRQNADVIRALGMTGQFTARWVSSNDRFLTDHVRAMDIYANLGSAAKVLRYMLQSAILGIGAYLVVNDQASGGIMIASSIVMGRALAPIEIVLGTWKQLVAARQGLYRLREVLKTVGQQRRRAVALPPPSRELAVRDLAVVPPGTDRVILTDASFALQAGMGLAVIGPSAAGKSSLAKVLVGVWKPARGVVRLDGASLDQWHIDALGCHLGYLPQQVALFDGTIAENIARFDRRAPSGDIIEAARIAGVHDMILRLPDGYSMRIGEGGMTLSAGQRQRIGLARAIFGNPFVIVLDEPNANLDGEGETALARAIAMMRSKGKIVIVISHRPSALAVLDMVMVLSEGRVAAFGKRDLIFEQVAKQAAARNAAAAAVVKQRDDGRTSMAQFGGNST